VSQEFIGDILFVYDLSSPIFSSFYCQGAEVRKHKMKLQPSEWLYHK